MSTAGDLGNTFGAAYIGVIAGATLHGVSCVQAWYYYTHQTDPWPIQLLVAAVMLFDTVHQALISHCVYTYLVTGFGNLPQLSLIVWSLIVEVLFNGLTAFLVQGFLALRVWRLSNRNIIVTGLVLLLVLAEFVCVIVFFSLSINFVTFADLATISGLSITVNALAAAGDVLIAGTLCFLLHRSRTGFHRSDTIINKLIIFAVNTGALTSLCAIASLVSITARGDTFLYIAFFFCMGRLYTNSLLATLNARKMLRGGTDGVHSTSENISVSLREFPKNLPPPGVKPTNISIKIATTKEFVSDSDHGHDQSDLEIKDIERQQVDKSDSILSAKTAVYRKEKSSGKF